jgi:dihydroneopterin aldolase
MNVYHNPAQMPEGDRVIIEDLRIPACIGVYPHEKLEKQVVVMNIEMGLPTPACFRSDRVDDTIDYAAVADAVRQLAVSRHFNLIESLAEQVSNVIFDDFGAAWVKVRVDKIGVIPDAKCAAVAITRLNARMFGGVALSQSVTGARDTSQDLVLAVSEEAGHT